MKKKLSMQSIKICLETYCESDGSCQSKSETRSQINYDETVSFGGWLSDLCCEYLPDLSDVLLDADVALNDYWANNRNLEKLFTSY